MMLDEMNLQVSPHLGGGDDSNNGKQQSPPMMEITETSDLFIKAAKVTLTCWVCLVTTMYSITPYRELKYLSSSERQAALMALFALVVANLSMLIPFAIHRKDNKSESANGIVFAALTVQFIAISTNAILAFCPVMTTLDVVTYAPVYIVRWCEWVCLSGLMTFLSEGIDLKKSKKSIRNAIIASSMQSLSCVTGGLFCAYARTPSEWYFHMTISFLTYFIVFARVYAKRKAFMEFLCEESYYGRKEKHDRLRFSYALMTTCSIVWTVLVIIYFVNMYIHRVLPLSHPIRQMAPAMVCDTLFDVTAKALYMKWIVDVHFAVFDMEGRAMRQLSELRSLMSVLWNQSSDVIIVSVRHGNKIIAILSPSFLGLIAASDESTKGGGMVKLEGKALMMEVERTLDQEDNPQRGDEVSHITKAAYVDTDDIPYERWSNHNHQVPGDQLDPSDFTALNGRSLVAAAWHRAVTESAMVDDGKLMTYPFETQSGEERKSEIKVSKHGPNAIVCVVRDVTERYRRFEAERQAIAEVLRRQKDAQSQTRFVRHEVKNGLLAGIELCDTLKNEIDAALQILMPKIRRPDFDSSERFLSILPGEPTLSPADERKAKHAKQAQKCVENLDLLLHEVLETVLAEAMARDVVNEIYKPRSESLDVFAVLTSSVSTKSGKTERFPIEVVGGDMPFLQLDPQLLRYIHRNAVSNAAKYGKPGGKVNTVLQYNAKTKMLKMNVINEPADDQQRIIDLGPEKANEIVFSQGATLHSNGSIISSGDGAWIISKCAKTMGGTCSISFEKHQTVFSFEAKVEPIVADEIVSVKDFSVPKGTIGIAVDDSKIQRKLMRRMLSNVGVDDSMLEVIGETPTEVMGLKDILLQRMQAYPDSKILILVDENLDYGSTNVEQAESAMISGSLTMQRILNEMDDEQEARILTLVRSANDSAEDVALYTERTHGFIPKAPMHRERVREIIAPLWAGRFLQHHVDF